MGRGTACLLKDPEPAGQAPVHPSVCLHWPFKAHTSETMGKTSRDGAEARLQTGSKRGATEAESIDV